MPSVIEDWGHWRINADGQDVTSYRGATRQGKARYKLLEPFGCGPATIEIPAITPRDSPGSGTLTWLYKGSPIDVVRLDTGASKFSNWSGEITGWTLDMQENSGRLHIDAMGDMEVASLQMHQPVAYLPPTDIGTVIARALNKVAGRRYGKIAAVSTGIQTTKRGSDDMSVLAYCQELLADAVTDDGLNQWTVKRTAARTYAIMLKNVATVHWSVHGGQPGMPFRFSNDGTQAATRIFGSGVDTDGFAWSNMVYPGARADDAPAYPYASPATTIDIGDTDAGTTSGSGVSDWQRRANELNISRDVAVDGVYNSNDAAAAREIQRHYGLLVDGIVGPQTWAGTHDVGGGASIGKMVRLPLAWISAAQPTLQNADGSLGAANPDFDPDMLIVDKDVNFGDGVNKRDGKRAARAMLARDYPAGLTGSMTLTADPLEGHRFNINVGQNIKVFGIKGGSGQDPLLHITAVDVDTDGPVELMLDEKARDLVNLVQIRQRDKTMSVDSTRLPRNRKQRHSNQVRDAVVPFDGESRGGIIPRFALYAGLWSVIRIPVAQSGVIAKTAATTVSATPFAMAIFGAPIKPSNLVSIVGNPLASDDPWEPNEDDLDDFGWVEGWGSSEEKCGVTRGGTVTGRFRDNGTLEFRSLRPPVLWLAFYAASACRISGRLYPAPLQP